MLKVAGIKYPDKSENKLLQKKSHDSREIIITTINSLDIFFRWLFLPLK